MEKQKLPAVVCITDSFCKKITRSRTFNVCLTAQKKMHPAAVVLPTRRVHFYAQNHYRSLRGKAAMAQKSSSYTEQAWKISRQRARRSGLRPSQVFSANAAQSRQASS